MSIFDFLNSMGGLALFLFGMAIMGQALERRAGNKLSAILRKLTTGKMTGLCTGIIVTSIIQSSSATTVMVVGFVNSGLMTLQQSINVIMGANIGTTVTAWILSLAGINSDNFFVQFLKPTSFTPILALIGIFLYMMPSGGKKRDTGLVMLGFATLMFGMDTMAGSVAGLSDVPEFRQMFLYFSNPILGVLVGAVLTAIIQSSSASVGILQALSMTGQVTYGATIPIIMGQNIGTCVTAMLSSIGTNKNAHRAALVHLSFNVIGTIVCITLFMIVKAMFMPAILSEPTSLVGIAIAHSAFNIICTALMLPLSGLLEKLALTLIPETEDEEKNVELDERLLQAPALALEQCKAKMSDMAGMSFEALYLSLDCIFEYNPYSADRIRYLENKTDKYEDVIGTYLVKLSAVQLSKEDSSVAAEYLKLIGDFERIGDHSTNILNSAEELSKNNIPLTDAAVSDLKVLMAAVKEITENTYEAFIKSDADIAVRVEPLEQVIDYLKDSLRTRHISRLQQGDCVMEASFVWSDLITNMERVADHCSNIAGCIIDVSYHNMNMHQMLRDYRDTNENYREAYQEYRNKYALV